VNLLGAMILAFILIVPLEAEATSAWVLWAQQTRPGDPKDRGGHWEIVRAVPRHEDCELQLRAEVHRAGEQQKQSSGAVVKVTQFYCLPDTVDPRGRRDGRGMGTSTWLQAAGLVFGVISALLIVLARPATSAGSEPGGRRVITLRSPVLLYLGLFALALGFVFQGVGLICGTIR
jgi:hypothetical protein